MGRSPSWSFSTASKEEEREETEGKRRQREKISKPAPESAMRDGTKKE